MKAKQRLLLPTNDFVFKYAQTEEDFMQAAAQNPLICKAYGIIRTLSHDEETRLLAQSREKALRNACDSEEGARLEE